MDLYGIFALKLRLKSRPHRPTTKPKNRQRIKGVDKRSQCDCTKRANYNNNNIQRTLWCEANAVEEVGQNNHHYYNFHSHIRMYKRIVCVPLPHTHMVSPIIMFFQLESHNPTPNPTSPLLVSLCHLDLRFQRDAVLRVEQFGFN